MLAWIGIIIIVFSLIITIAGGFLITSQTSNLKNRSTLPKSNPTNGGWIILTIGITFFFIGAILMIAGGHHTTEKVDKVAKKV